MGITYETVMKRNAALTALKVAARRMLDQYEGYGGCDPPIPETCSACALRAALAAMEEE